MRKVFLLAWLGIILSGIGYIFWHEDWKYSLPTPVPENYNPAQPGDVIRISDKIKSEGDKPLFVHFFNPACPCSRFNVPHFRSLVRKYGDQLNFAVVVMSADRMYTEEEIRDKFDLETIPVFFDKAIADSCGVYSTPQAVLLDTRQKLYYRGNYNKSRYCADKGTNYAQMAIDSLLDNKSNLITDQAALKSYGCTLPTCTK